MSKLLNEATIRRFQTLANIPGLKESHGRGQHEGDDYVSGREDLEEGKGKEEEKEEEELDEGMVRLEEGETLEQIKARLKPKKSTIGIDMLDTANSYDDKVALVRFLVSEDSRRVAIVLKNMMKDR